jgi:hypothetical protein
MRAHSNVRELSPGGSNEEIARPDDQPKNPSEPSRRGEIEAEPRRRCERTQTCVS